MSSKKIPRAVLPLFLVAATLELYADPPTVTALSPRGARRGQTVTLLVHGAHLSEAAELIGPFSAASELVTDDAELTPTASRVAFRVRLNANEAPGPCPLRLRTEEGVSNPLLFVVGTFDEKNETEPNELVTTANPIEPPVTINGTIGSRDRDTFRFRAPAGARLVFEVEARRIGSALDPTLRLLRPNGRELALSDDPPGLCGDSRIDYTFEKAGEYLVQLQDVMFRGRTPGFYRLKVGSYPYADAIFPMGGREGSSIQIWLEGGNLETPLSTSQHLDHGFLVSMAQVSLPPDRNIGGVLPFPLRVGRLPEVLESAGSKEDEPIGLEPDVTVNGRLDAPGQVDRYAVSVEPNEEWVFALEAARLGSWLDPVLTVQDDGGKRLARADDSGGSLDPRLDFKVPGGTKRVFLVVSDLHARGGKAYSYRLTVRRRRPDFSLELTTTRAALPLSGSAVLEVACARQGYGGRIELSLTQVPVGFEVRGGEILPDQNKGYLSLTGPAKGALRFEELTVIGRGGTPEEPIVRRAEKVIHLATDENVALCPLQVSSVSAAVVAPQLFSLAVPAARVDVPVGVAVPVDVALRRRDGVDGEIKLSGVHAFAGVAVKDGKAGAGATKGSLQLSAAPNAELREGDVLVRGTVKWKKRDYSFPGPAFRARVVRPFSIAVTDEPVVVPAGKAVSVTGRVHRVAPFAGSVSIRLDGLPPGVTAKAIEVNGKEADFSVDVVAGADAKPGSSEVKLLASTAFPVPKKKPVVHSLPAVPCALVVAESEDRRK